jgi:gamma-glutamyltranspeptidase/glutathione hydrolase
MARAAIATQVGEDMHGRRPTISSTRGVVAAAHPLAAQAGARLLAQGGNAFDAAAATAAALNVVEPYMSGLAGAGLATCWIAAERRVKVLDFVPRVPAKFPLDRFSKREDLARGPLSAGVPGNLAGWAELVRAHGKKPLGDALAPATALARDGFPLVEFNVDETNEHAPAIQSDPALRGEFTRNYLRGGNKVEAGRVLAQPELAATFERLAAEGPQLLYGGALGKAIVTHLEKLGGYMAMSDLEQVAPKWKDPLVATYRGHAVHVPPPACESFQFLLTLRILEGFDLARLERNGADHLDIVYRAIRLAAGVRINNNNPSPQKLAELLHDDHVEQLRARVRDGRPVAGPTEQWMEPPKGEDPGHTTSFSIADHEGNLICVTQSLGSPFGSGVVVPGTGVCLNNFLYWSEVTPKSPNRTQPGAELPICMAPTISTLDGKPVLALGTPGSYGILQTQAQAYVQYLDFAMPLQDAIEAPRARLWDGTFVQVEGRVPAAIVAALRERGHDAQSFADWTMKVGGMQAVAINPATGVMTGAADPRRDGYAVAL